MMMDHLAHIRNIVSADVQLTNGGELSLNVGIESKPTEQKQ